MPDETKPSEPAEEAPKPAKGGKGKQAAHKPSEPAEEAPKPNLTAQQLEQFHYTHLHSQNVPEREARERARRRAAETCK